MIHVEINPSYSHDDTSVELTWPFRGRNYGKVQQGDIKRITARGEELKWIYERFQYIKRFYEGDDNNELPYEVTWTGEDAQFIIDNLI